MSYTPKQRPGVLLYWETFETLTELEPEDSAEMLKAIYCYSHDGEAPKLSKNYLKAFWPTIKAKLDRDAEAYEQKRIQREEAGKASARKRQRALTSVERSLTSVERSSTSVNESQPTTTTTTEATATPTASPSATPTASNFFPDTISGKSKRGAGKEVNPSSESLTDIARFAIAAGYRWSREETEAFQQRIKKHPGESLAAEAQRFSAELESKRGTAI